VWHNGGRRLSQLHRFDPTRRIGVVVLCNNGNENVDDIGFHLLDETFRSSPAAQAHRVAVDSLYFERYIGSTS